MPNPVKSLGYFNCYSLSCPDQLKAPAVLSDATVRRSVVNREDLKPHWKSGKMRHFSG